MTDRVWLFHHSPWWRDWPSGLADRRRVILQAGALIAVIAIVDGLFEQNIAFGFLYFLPILMLGGVLSPLQIGITALLCTVLTEIFDPVPWLTLVALPRVTFTFAAYYGTGLFVWQAAAARRKAADYASSLETEVAFRRSAEEQLQFLVKTSPAAIFLTDESGAILLSNAAATQLLRLQPSALTDSAITAYFPSLFDVFPLDAGSRALHLSLECRGLRPGGEIFQAHIWFSTFRTVSGPRLAAVVSDVSEELRDREEFGLEQAISGSRIVAGAVFHEVRNISAAIGAVFRRVTPKIENAKDRAALLALLEGLERVASAELFKPKRSAGETLLASVLEDVRIILDPAFAENDVAVDWGDWPPNCRVRAERHALLQVLLNIAKNSIRALQGVPDRRFSLAFELAPGTVTIRLRDSGPGVAAPENLFKPFQTGAVENGLGLYLSQLLVRSYNGEIYYEQHPVGCSFAVRLPTAPL